MLANQSLGRPLPASRDVELEPQGVVVGDPVGGVARADRCQVLGPWERARREARERQGAVPGRGEPRDLVEGAGVTWRLTGRARLVGELRVWLEAVILQCL